MEMVVSLLASLDSPDGGEARTAMVALGKTGSGRYHLLPGLLHRLRHAPLAHSREAAAYVLYEWNDLSDGLWGERITGALLAALTDGTEEPTVRGQAAEALAWHYLMRGRCPVVAPLLATLDDSSPEVRFWAAYALGIIGAHDALPALERLAATDHATVPFGAVGEEAVHAITTIHARRRRAHPPHSRYHHK